MREKIAEAIWQAEWARAGNRGSRRIQWSDNSEETMDKYRFLADAVLDALMDPTEGMVSAGANRLVFVEFPAEEDFERSFISAIRAATEGR